MGKPPTPGTLARVAHSKPWVSAPSPARCWRFLGPNAAGLTDTCLDLALLATPPADNLGEQLAAGPAYPRCADQVAAWLRAGVV